MLETGEDGDDIPYHTSPHLTLPNQGRTTMQVAPSDSASQDNRARRSSFLDLMNTIVRYSTKAACAKYAIDNHPKYGNGR
jgi:hypothetical protein